MAELLAGASDILGVIITLVGSKKEDCMDKEGNLYDFISRYFAPWLGIVEDPVTGNTKFLFKIYPFMYHVSVKILFKIYPFMYPCFIT